MAVKKICFCFEGVVCPDCEYRSDLCPGGGGTELCNLEEKIREINSRTKHVFTLEELKLIGAKPLAKSPECFYSKDKGIIKIYEPVKEESAESLYTLRNTIKK